MGARCLRCDTELAARDERCPSCGLAIGAVVPERDEGVSERVELERDPVAPGEGYPAENMADSTDMRGPSKGSPIKFVIAVVALIVIVALLFLLMRAL
jgi:hypothetical protein